MLSVNLDIVLFIGMCLMCILIAIQMKWYGDAWWKSIFISIWIIITGVMSCDIWFALENGFWGGKSFFGALFIAPVTFAVIAKPLKIPYRFCMDYCATAGCLVLSLLKTDCLVKGCCRGITLWQTASGENVRFPCQLLELLSAIVLMIVALIISKKQKNRGRIYPIIMTAYGVVRFVLNLFRDDWERTHNMGLILPLGNIWSLIAILIGAIWLFVLFKRNNPQKSLLH